MPYVDRDGAGKITGAYGAPQRAGHEWVDESAPEVAAYNAPRTRRKSAAEKLADLLVDKAVIARAEADTATGSR